MEWAQPTGGGRAESGPRPDRRGCRAERSRCGAGRHTRCSLGRKPVVRAGQPAVGLYTATDSHTIHFHQLQRGTADRIRNRRVNERTGKEVELDDIVKGYDAGGEYILVEPNELDEIAPGGSRSLEIAGFVDLAEVDPIFFDKTYYLGPRGKEYGKVYSLLE